MAVIKKRKAEDGDYLSSDGKTYTYTKKVKRPEGDRYYTGKSASSTMAQRMADNRAYNRPADSTRTADVERGALKKLNEQKNGGKTPKKNWIQSATASIKRRGTEGKCTPITKPGCTGKAKALAKTFKKMAAKRKGK